MIIAAAIIAAVICAVAYSLGNVTGERRGRALGWLERNDQEINRDAKRREKLNSRRDRDGTFQEAKQ